MSKLIFAVFAAFSFGLFAQEAHVYPYRAEISFREDIILLMDEVPDSVVSLLTDYYFDQVVGDERYFYYEDEEITDEAAKRRIRMEAVSRNIAKVRENYKKSELWESREVSYRKTLKVYRHNYDMFLSVRARPEVTPYLEPLPDGRYVQYYKPFPLVLPNGSVTIVRDAVACSFYFKNNKMEGPATWYYPMGEVRAIVSYKNGFLDGKAITVDYMNYFWFYMSRDRYRRAAANDFHLEHYPDSVVCYYEGGVKNGPYRLYELNSKWPRESGFYAHGEPSGTWIKREVFQVFDDDSTKYASRYTYADTAIVSHDPVILRDKVSSAYFAEGNPEFYFTDDGHVSFDFSNLFEPAYPRDSTGNLELEEEKFRAYEEMNPTDGVYVSGELGRSQAIDSFGVYYKYDGLYEVYHYNGNLLYRTYFKNGHKSPEDTVYYEDGTPFLITHYRADSADYEYSVYDMKAGLVNRFYFDSSAAFKYAPNTEKTTQYMGYPFQWDNYMERLSYKIDEHWRDSLGRDSMLLEMYISLDDSSVTYSEYYFPPQRALKANAYTVSGKKLYSTEIVFGEGFEFWNGSGLASYADFSQKYTLSASFEPGKSMFLDGNGALMSDTLPEARIFSPSMGYHVTSETQLLKDGMPFTGNLQITFGGSRYKFRSGDADLFINLPLDRRYQKKLSRSYERFLETGRVQENDILNELSSDMVKNNFYHWRAVSFFFSDFTRFGALPALEPDKKPDDASFDYDRFLIADEKTNPARITGAYLDGEPEGTWQILNRENQLLSEIRYEKGELNGLAKTWRLQPGYETIANSEYMPGRDILADSLPAEDRLFLLQEDHYKNGMLDGLSRTYSWYGEITEEKQYRNGLQEGDAFERNKYAYTTMHFENGELDGIVKTWFYRSPQDSILLYDINFQNGTLQGESRSYHTNGKLAKRGFFLGGRPIDDYEAFDSLGFKYQYVRFKYTFPVEEKVWELNELSVRYEFDWRDSIPFEPSDITSVETLDNMLAELGMVDYYEMYGRPYAGRPRLIDKTGIDYHITKYYPNGLVARDGYISDSKKTGCWQYFNYDGRFLYEIQYKDSIVALNDSIRFRSKGICYRYDDAGNLLSSSYVIEKFEKYDCSHTDHYEVRQFYTFYQSESDSVDRMNGPVRNYYDNGVLQSEGMMKNGLPDGVWKFYDPFGNLNQVGTYVLGKRDGRWLGGDLSKTRFLGEICLNPNLPDLEEEIAYREKQLNIVITNYRMGRALNKEFFDVDLNKIVEE